MFQDYLLSTHRRSTYPRGKPHCAIWKEKIEIFLGRTNGELFKEAITGGGDACGTCTSDLNHNYSRQVFSLNQAKANIDEVREITDDEFGEVKTFSVSSKTT